MLYAPDEKNEKERKKKVYADVFLLFHERSLPVSSSGSTFAALLRAVYLARAARCWSLLKDVVASMAALPAVLPSSARATSFSTRSLGLFALFLALSLSAMLPESVVATETASPWQSPDAEILFSLVRLYGSAEKVQVPEWRCLRRKLFCFLVMAQTTADDILSFICLFMLFTRVK